MIGTCHGVKIEGAVALVTGSNRGLGKPFVRALLDAGAAKVYAAARDASRVIESGATPVGLDIRNDHDIAAAADACRDVTVLVNNAGIAKFSPLIGAIHGRGSRRNRRELSRHACHVWCVCARPRREWGGVIVNVLSVVSWVTVPVSGSYCVSKAAELAMTNGVRVELGAQGTLVVGVHAGVHCHRHDGEPGN
jgi:NAD(P)-dependent dehydrogenase (short-subunit alcohol dehydrogenase family)